MEAQAAAEAGDELKQLNINTMVKPLHKIVADNKDVVKVTMQLNAAVVMHRNDVNERLAVFSVYDQLWNTVTRAVVLIGRNTGLHGPFVCLSVFYGLLTRKYFVSVLLTSNHLQTEKNVMQLIELRSDHAL